MYIFIGLLFHFLCAHVLIAVCFQIKEPVAVLGRGGVVEEQCLVQLTVSVWLTNSDPCYVIVSVLCTFILPLVAWGFRERIYVSFIMLI